MALLDLKKLVGAMGIESKQWSSQNRVISICQFRNSRQF